MTDKTIPFSVLDLAPIPEGSSAKEAFTHSLDLARLAEKRGYHRYWLAEHHNMTGIASAATSVLIGYLAANTTTLHLGSGGVMLPNHSPLVIAEQFGTLNTLYPGRIDLGLGRAPGSDQPQFVGVRQQLKHQRRSCLTILGELAGGEEQSGSAIAQHIERARLPHIVGVGEECVGARADRGGQGWKRLRRIDRRDAVERRPEFRRRRGGRHMALPRRLRQRPGAEHRKGRTCQQPFFRDHGSGE